MIRRDFQRVMEIEQACFDCPWTLDELIKVLQARDVVGKVTEIPIDGDISGFIVYRLSRYSFEILSIAVDPENQRNGIATNMIDGLKLKLDYYRRVHINALVRERNLAAQLFFFSQGFRAVRIHREFYDETNEDAYLFQLRI